MCEHEPDEMIKTVDKNEDGKISYSEFRVKFLETFRIFWSTKRTEKTATRNSG
jgi:hypothetical protein